jgi:hypothetical protein
MKSSTSAVSCLLLRPEEIIPLEKNIRARYHPEMPNAINAICLNELEITHGNSVH